MMLILTQPGSAQVTMTGAGTATPGSVSVSCSNQLDFSNSCDSQYVAVIL